MSITHGDYRLDNLMFPPAGPGVAAVDWQTTSAGPPLRDLAYFLGNSLTPDLRRAHESDLVDSYLGGRWRATEWSTLLSGRSRTIGSGCCKAH